MTRPDADAWKACPPGELGRLSSRLRSRRTRRAVARSAAAVAAVALLAIGAWAFRPRGGATREYDFAGIRCGRVLALAQDYAMHKLDASLSAQIKSHVEQCPRCHPRFKAMGLAAAIRPRRTPAPESALAATPHPPGRIPPVRG